MRAIHPNDKFSLLIVHDDEDMRNCLEKSALETGRFISVRCMADGRFALEHLWSSVKSESREMPDILVTDLKVAGLNGIQLTREVRRFNELREIFVAIVASSGGPLEQDAAETAGCDFFVRQPATAPELAKLLHDIANRCAIKASVPERLFG